MTRTAGELLSWITTGRLAPPQVQAFAFDDVARAHAALESGKSVGRVVLTVS